MSESQAAAEWFADHTYTGDEFPLDDLVARKADAGLRISVVLPSRDVVRTVAGVVEAVRTLSGTLVDEIVVIDAASTDGTPEAARAAGATTFDESEIHPELGPGRGKGDAMWRSLAVTTGDLVVFMDTDIRNPGPHFVQSVLGPLLVRPEVQLVKGFYRRPIEIGGVRFPSGGGRVTELCARPLLNAFWPELGWLVHPLSGEFCGRRELFESIPFCTGYGVEIAMLIDTYQAVGLDAMAQVDLGERVHTNQPLEALSRMAFEVSQAALRRLPRLRPAGGNRETFVQFDRDETGAPKWTERGTRVLERPPLREFRGGTASA